MFKGYVLAFFVAVCTITYQSVAANKVEENYKEIVQLQGKNHLIPLTKDLFVRLARGPARNFSMLVLFTAISPQRACQACQVAHGEVIVLADSLYHQLRSSNEPQSVFLGMVDFDAAPDAFQMMKLQTAPVLYYFAPKQVRGKEPTLDFNRYGLSAESMAAFIAEHSGVRVKVVYPPDYSKVFIVILMIALAGVVGYLKPAVYSIFMRHIFWVVIVLGTLFSMLSGQMWNHIRNPPFMQRGRDGVPQYIAGHSQSQYVAESYIVAFLDFLTTAGLVLLGDNSKWFRRSYIPRSYINLAGMALFAIIFGYILFIFRSKYGGYPYSFIF